MALEKFNSMHKRKIKNYPKKHRLTAIKHLKSLIKKNRKNQNPAYWERMNLETLEMMLDEFKIKK